MQYIFQKIGNQALAALILLLGATTLQSQSFSIGNLPAGKTIVITYDVTVNPNACANNMIPLGNLSNQSQVQGSNFSTVNTDDPDVPEELPYKPWLKMPQGGAAVPLPIRVGK